MKLCFQSILLLLFLVAPAFGMNYDQVIAGAGPSTEVVEAFVPYLASHEAAQGYAFTVPKESAKHAGGIRNTEHYVFGRTGRPLNAKEKAAGVEEIFLAKMPIAFVAGARAGVRDLTLDQVCGIFTGKYSNWNEVGGNDENVVVITREPTEALFLELKRELPCMNEVRATPFVLKKDDHVIAMLKTSDFGQGAIGFGAAANFPQQVQVNIADFDSGVRLGLVYKTSNSDHALVRAAMETARSDQWRSVLKRMGLGSP